MPTGGNGIRIAVICGSVRPGNYTSHAVALVLDELSQRSDVSIESVDPSSMHLPLPGQDGDVADVEALMAKVSACTGVIFATPEYHGSFSSVTKLIIENLGFPSVLAGKPVALLGVAAGAIGAIKSLEQLRNVCSHVGAIVLPGPVSVAHVRDVFDDKGICLDERVEAQVRGLPNRLMDYIDRHVCPAVSLEAMVREGVSG